MSCQAFLPFFLPGFSAAAAGVVAAAVSTTVAARLIVVFPGKSPEFERSAITKFRRNDARFSIAGNPRAFSSSFPWPMRLSRAPSSAGVSRKATYSVATDSETLRGRPVLIDTYDRRK